MALQFIESTDFGLLKAELDLTLGSIFTAVHVNIRSLRKYREQFLITAEDLGDRVDAFILTETNISDVALGPSSIGVYNEFFFTRPSGKGGGIGFL